MEGAYEEGASGAHSAESESKLSAHVAQPSSPPSIAPSAHDRAAPTPTSILTEGLAVTSTPPEASPQPLPLMAAAGAAAQAWPPSLDPTLLPGIMPSGEWQRQMGWWGQMASSGPYGAAAPTAAELQHSAAAASGVGPQGAMVHTHMGQILVGHAPTHAMPIGHGVAGPSGVLGTDAAGMGLGKQVGGVAKRSPKKPRLVWTQELHSRFINAVNHLGVKNAVPKTILQLMNVEGMTRENVASHLQKYRLFLKKLVGIPANAPVPSDIMQQVQAAGIQQAQLHAMHMGGQAIMPHAPPFSMAGAQPLVAVQQQQLAGLPVPGHGQEAKSQHVVPQQLQFLQLPPGQAAPAGAGGQHVVLQHPQAGQIPQWHGASLAFASFPYGATAAAAASGQQPGAAEQAQLQQAGLYAPTHSAEQAASLAYHQYPLTVLGYQPAGEPQQPGGAHAQIFQAYQPAVLQSQATQQAGWLPAASQAAARQPPSPSPAQPPIG